MSPSSSKDIEVLNELPPDQNVLPVEGKLCMCTLCTCGQHKCPPKRDLGASGFPPDRKSEYIQKYPAWPLAARKAHKPPPAPINEAPFSGLTTYHVDFEKKKIPQRQRHVPSGKTLENCIPSGELTDAVSEYATRFTKFPVQPRHPHQKPPVQANSAPFDDRTTNKCDYKQWPLVIRAPTKQAENSKSDGVFDDITTYKVAFWDKSKNLKPFRRTEKPKLVETGPFHGTTTHAADYGPKPLLKRAPPVKHEASLTNPGGALFDGLTTYHDKFRAWEIRRPVRGIRMKEALPMPSESFAGNTTYHTDFTAPRMPRRCPVLLKPKPIHQVGEHLCY
ncbi:hypothetical protein O6H91_01G025700 [Diphasiastrum complanatum]|uniref:Uncharacterized protein n=5 Tax=Diphasiastrum complanatum TaxID=34168 RepID=A0ACC2EPB4_DIPCM|nr:hypothetical protein O6H91_01G025700 [Diphasiastrum complanatum]KAJ7568277.1 hypothetical protein O6H91_01G025700 [Diphasiastrum complanatum]KAJ7568278.1 hypothetical protein O6H91_01G025700 [Diphasiastrum complanatum]KAJ7568279.1 hypothetical protein O6H91_01G025700 [Diphasiastrum complanatum]KAJ7568280.1 hypothetical protein O6H91_01G025700 [Diphasiastrum complanatum]